MISTPKIRKAERTDIATIVRFNQAMALETEGHHLDQDILTSGVTAVLDRDELGFYLVCEMDGDVRACLMITFEWSDWRNGLFWWIQSVYVQKEYRRKGLFKLLYTHVKTLIAQMDGIAGIRLYVDANNKNAQKVYESLGMKRTQYELFEYIQEKK